MTLTDFLLARIAEDEARIPTGLARVIMGGQARYVDPSAERLRAECEAKRRIVEVHAHNSRWDDTNIGDWARATLELLALPYADHDDYDESWRP